MICLFTFSKRSLWLYSVTKKLDYFLRPTWPFKTRNICQYKNSESRFKIYKINSKTLVNDLLNFPKVGKIRQIWSRCWLRPICPVAKVTNKLLFTFRQTMQNNRKGLKMLWRKAVQKQMDGLKWEPNLLVSDTRVRKIERPRKSFLIECK